MSRGEVSTGVERKRALGFAAGIVGLAVAAAAWLLWGSTPARPGMQRGLDPVPSARSSDSSALGGIDLPVRQPVESGDDECHVTVVDEGGAAIEGVELYLCDARARRLARASRAGVSNAGGSIRVAVPLERAARAPMAWFMRSGFVPRSLAARTLENGTIVRMTAAVPMRVHVHVQGSGVPVEGAVVMVSQQALARDSGAETDVKTGGESEVAGPAAPHDVGMTNREGDATVRACAGGSCVLTAAKDGYVVAGGNPQQVEQGGRAIDIGMYRLYGAVATASDDEILGFRYEAPRWFAIPAACAEELLLTRRRANMRWGDHAIKVIGVLAPEYAPSGTEACAVTVFTRSRGTVHTQVDIVPWDGIRAPTVLQLAGRKSDTGQLTVLLDGVGKVLVPKMVVVPTGSAGEADRVTVAMKPGEPLTLPEGTYRVKAVEPYVDAQLLQPESGATVSGGSSCEYRVAVKGNRPLRPVRFASEVGSDGRMVGSARVTCTPSGEGPGARRVVRGVTDLAESVFWLTAGKWDVEIVAPDGLRLTVAIEVTAAPESEEMIVMVR